MAYLVARTLKQVLTGGVCGCFLLTSIATSAEVDVEKPIGKYHMTVLKEWTPNDDLNGSFEAERRAWLASLRAQMNKEHPDPNEIIIETLNDEDEDIHEFSRDTLNDFMEQISKELEEQH